MTPDVLARAVDTVTPNGLAAIAARVEVSVAGRSPGGRHRTARVGPRRRGRPWQRGHPPAGRRRPPAPPRWSSAGARSTPATRSACAPRRARSSTCPSPAGETPSSVLAALGSRGRSARGHGGRVTACPYDETDLRGPVAVVLGSEAHGLPAEVRALVDQQITIPMAGRSESLNVAMAGSVLCFEALRQRRTARARRTDWRGPRLSGEHPPQCAPRSTPSRPTPLPRIAAASTLDELRALDQELLGKKSPLSSFKTQARRAGPRRATRGRRRDQPRARRARRRARGEARASSSRRRAATQLQAERLDLTEVPPAGGAGHLHLVTQAMETPRGRLRGDGLHHRRGPRGRDRLAQLRRPQLPAGPSGPGHVRHASTSRWASRARRSCARTPRPCRCG